MEAISRIVADIETGFNTNDPDLLVAHFIRNASAVNVMGIRTSGWDALRETHRQIQAGPLRDEYVRYQLRDVVFLRSDVAIAHKLAWAVTADGDPIDADEAMIALYVFVRSQGRWWIASRQNTLVR